MKTRNIILLALTALLAISCHSWDDPAEGAGRDSFGNKYLQENNVVTISDLLTKYKSQITSGSMKQITSSTQIKAIVTGNDEGSNIYKNLYVIDATGGLCIKIDKSSIFAEAAVGQCLLIELEGLFIGGYGQQPQIGTQYLDGTTLKIGNINRNTWAEHFKLIPAIEGLSAKPITTNDMTALDIDKDYGKVVTLVGITMEKADGKEVFAPGSSGTVNQKVAGQASTVYIRTSTYAKFAKMVMPTERFNITGVISRYNDEWQIYPRTLNDIQPYTGTEKLDYEVDNTPPQPKGDGTLGNPFNPAAANAEAAKLGDGEVSAKQYYIKGIVAKIPADANYGEGKYPKNANFYISENGKNAYTFYIYGAKYLGNVDYSSGDVLKVGDEVIILGNLTKYNGTNETAQGKNYLYSLNGNTGGGGGDTPTPPAGNVTKSVEGTVVTLTNTTVTASTNTVSVDLNEQGWEDGKEPTTVTLNDGTTIVFGKGEGGSTPKFYANTKGVRMYAKNTIVITGASKAIAKVVLNCDSYGGTDYVGNTTLFGSASDKKLTVVNEHTGTSGGTQLRVKTIDITYAQ